MWFEVPVPDVDECDDTVPFDSRGVGPVHVCWLAPVQPCRTLYVVSSAHRRLGPAVAQAHRASAASAATPVARLDIVAADSETAKYWFRNDPTVKAIQKEEGGKLGIPGLRAE